MVNVAVHFAANQSHFKVNMGTPIKQRSPVQGGVLYSIPRPAKLPTEVFHDVQEECCKTQSVIGDFITLSTETKCKLQVCNTSRTEACTNSEVGCFPFHIIENK